VEQRRVVVVVVVVGVGGGTYQVKIGLGLGLGESNLEFLISTFLDVTPRFNLT